MKKALWCIFVYLFLIYHFSVPELSWCKQASSWEVCLQQILDKR
jgi:hypothetical protein